MYVCLKNSLVRFLSRNQKITAMMIYYYNICMFHFILCIAWLSSVHQIHVYQEQTVVLDNTSFSYSVVWNEQLTAMAHKYNCDQTSEAKMATNKKICTVHLFRSIASFFTSFVINICALMNNYIFVDELSQMLFQQLKLAIESTLNEDLYFTCFSKEGRSTRSLLKALIEVAVGGNGFIS